LFISRECYFCTCFFHSFSWIGHSTSYNFTAVIFEQCSATMRGGALYIDDTCQYPYLRNVSFVSNRAPGGGKDIFDNGGLSGNYYGSSTVMYAN
jgi:hypothetical protein